jgi:NTP pyrophosphatase (non-canonical NTP hydrolase)
MKFEELNQKIVQWAEDRNLVTEENATKQMVKVVEEVGELAAGILRKDRELTTDSIGDVLVTIIILSAQLGLDPMHCLGAAYEEIKNRKGKTQNGIFIKEEGKKIHIITPCSRPENLETISKSIPKECNWIIMVDSSVQQDVSIDNATVIKSHLTGHWGHPLRNEAIEHLKSIVSEDDYICFLDDDNIIHPDWYESVKDCTGDVVIWGQLSPDGSHRLSATSNPQIGNVDTGSFMAKIKAIGESKFNNGYVADGDFVIEIVRNNSSNVQLIDSQIAYYNYLR